MLWNKEPVLYLMRPYDMLPKVDNPAHTPTWTTYGTYKLDITTPWRNSNDWRTDTKWYSTSENATYSVSPTPKDNSRISTRDSDFLLARRKWTLSPIVAKHNYTRTLDYTYE